MSLNHSTNGERFQTIYVYRYDYIHFEFGRGFNLPHYVGYEATLEEPFIPKADNPNNKNKMIEIIKVDTEKMHRMPIDDYFKKILFCWNDDKYKKKYEKWREWIKEFEVTEVATHDE